MRLTIRRDPPTTVDELPNALKGIARPDGQLWQLTIEDRLFSRGCIEVEVQMVGRQPEAIGIDLSDYSLSDFAQSLLEQITEHDTLALEDTPCYDDEVEALFRNVIGLSRVFKRAKAQIKREILEDLRQD